MKKFKITSLPNNNFQKGGTNSKKDKWGRSPDSKWYGFDPKTKKWTLGKKQVMHEVTVHPKKGQMSSAELAKQAHSGKKDKWGRPYDSKWWGFNPKTKKWEDGIVPTWYEEQQDWRNNLKVLNPALDAIGNTLSFLGVSETPEEYTARVKKERKAQANHINKLNADRKKMGLSKLPYSNAYNNYNDSPVQMVYPEKYFMGPRSAFTAGANAAKNVGSGILRGISRVNKFGLNNFVPKILTRGMTLGEQAALKSRLSPFTVGNILTAQSAAKVGTENIPEILQGKDVGKNYLEMIASLVPLTAWSEMQRVNDVRNIYNLGRYGLKNLNDPYDLEDQYKFYRTLGTLSGHKDGGEIPKAQIGLQTNPLYPSNNLLIKKQPVKKSLAKDTRPSLKKQNEAAQKIYRKKVQEPAYIKALATGNLSAFTPGVANAVIANVELERQKNRLENDYYSDIYEQEEKKFEKKPLTKWSQWGMPILDLFDTGSKVGQFVRDFGADPLNVGEELIWDQDYLPNRSAILRDPSNPLYPYYMKRTGMDRSPMSQMLQYVNPLSSGAEATVKIRNKDYMGALGEYGEGLGKAAALGVGIEALPGIMGTTVALPEAIATATGLTGTTTVGGVLGAGFAGYGLTKVPETSEKIAKAISSGNKEDWREAVNATGLNLLDFVGTGEFLESTKPFAGALSETEGAVALANDAKRLAREKEILGPTANTFDANYFRNALQQYEQENPFDWSTIDDVDSGFEAQIYNDLASVESDMHTLDARIDDLFMNEHNYDPEVFKRLLNDAQEERQVLSDTYDQLAEYKNQFNLNNLSESEYQTWDAPEFNEREYYNSFKGVIDQNLDNMIVQYNQYDDKISELLDKLNFGIDPSDINKASELQNSIDELQVLRDNVGKSIHQEVGQLYGLDGLDSFDEISEAEWLRSLEGQDDMLDNYINTYNTYDARINQLRGQITSSTNSDEIVNLKNQITDLKKIKDEVIRAANDRNEQIISGARRPVQPYSSTAQSPIVVNTTVSPADRANELNTIFTENSAYSGSIVSDIKPFNFSEETLNQLNDNIVSQLSNAENPSDLLSSLNYRFRRNNLTQEAYDELADALFHTLKQHGRSNEYIKDLKNIRRIINKDIDLLDTTYTGSDRSLSELKDWYKNIKDDELNQLDWMYQYDADDIDRLYRLLDDDEAKKVFLNQVYDDYRYMLRSERNPNNRPFNLRTGEIKVSNFKPSEFSNANVDISEDDLKLLKIVTQDGIDLFTGKQRLGNHPIMSQPEKLKNLNAIQKTEDLDNLIDKFGQLEAALTDPRLKLKVLQFVEDLKSTKWLRTEYVKELKEAGLNPQGIQDASIISYQTGNPTLASKMLVTKDGEVVGTLDLTPIDVTMEDGTVKPIMDISYSAVNYKFHPYGVGKKYSKFKNWNEVEEHLLKESLSPEYQDLISDIAKAKSNEDLINLEDKIYEKRLKTFPEEVRDKSFVKTRAKGEISKISDEIKQAKQKVKTKINQVEQNNNNAWGEALYRATHHGIKDTRGPVVTHEHFIDTDLPDPITREIITRPRGKDFWYGKMKQFKKINGVDVPKASHLFPNRPKGYHSGNFIQFNWKRGGNIPKLRKFII